MSIVIEIFALHAAEILSNNVWTVEMELAWLSTKHGFFTYIVGNPDS